ncbi:uncharacterized protein DFL_008060 [Arthrobotrys flagrans]|uniref:Uncharacterized protein n=1 Tax=Arthrobotrys flagrans TaxID=97331 RepID=A0A436ZMP3_ARTFL|nr:hypothetical protein DFL_008060 [Arthrobotrys flagrans]
MAYATKSPPITSGIFTTYTKRRRDSDARGITLAERIQDAALAPTYIRSYDGNIVASACSLYFQILYNNSGVSATSLTYMVDETNLINGTETTNTSTSTTTASTSYNVLATVTSYSYTTTDNTHEYTNTASEDWYSVYHDVSGENPLFFLKEYTYLKDGY